MAGAAITITVLTLAAVNTLGIPVDLPTALLLSVVASLCACGASGVAGGSLLLIPLACNMFGIEYRHAGSCRGLYYRRIAGLLRNGAELFYRRLFTAAACQAEDERSGKQRPARLILAPLRYRAEGSFLYAFFNFERINSAFLHPPEAGIMFRPFITRKLPSIIVPLQSIPARSYG
jgi:hypothetical protein